jgi:hypothetical protein
MTIDNRTLARTGAEEAFVQLKLSHMGCTMIL